MLNTRLRLCSGIPLDARYEHSIMWVTKAAQQEYFIAKAAYTLDSYTYLRKDQVIRVDINIEELLSKDVNYCVVLNDESQYAQASERRWLYYFITRFEYINDKVTAIHVETDVIQTYQFDWEIPACFVEREHVLDDRPGANLVDEGLETGEYKCTGGHYLTELNELAIVVQSSVTLNNPIGEPVRGGLMNGVYSGYKLYCRTATNLGATVMNSVLSALSTKGVADGVASMWMYPKALIDANWDDEDDVTMLEVKGSKTAIISPPRIATLDGYTPRNLKLLTHPYRMLYLYNNLGEGAAYRLEQFAAGTINFQIYGSCGNEATVRMVPMNHRGYAIDNESGLSLTGYPTCAWTQDAYKIWLAQNTNTQALTLQSANVLGAVGAGQTVVSALMLDGSGVASGMHTMYSAYQQTAGVMASRADHAIQPPQAKGAQSGSVNITMDAQSFTLCDLSITSDFAKRLDAYFDMYGYRVNMVKVPNLTGRMIWNYIKTIGCAVLGGINANDRRRIGEIFDKGITLWRAPETMYMYELADSNIAPTR